MKTVAILSMLVVPLLSACVFEERSRDDYERRYAYFLNFARKNNCLKGDGPATATLTEAAILTYLDFLQTYARPVTVAGSLRKILTVAKVLTSARDWAPLEALVVALEREAHPRPRRHLVVPIDELYRLGLRLMNRADSERPLSMFRRALLYRDGLMIALLSATVLRRRNLSELTPDRTIVATGDRWSVSIPARQAKSRLHIEIPLPLELTTRMERFLDYYRAAFGGSDHHNSLWPSRNGKPLSESQVYGRICKHSREAFGHAINPHLFRDCLATTVAIHDGAKIGTAIAVLGHTSAKTLDRHYNHAGMIDAAKTYHAALVWLERDDRGPDGGRPQCAP